MPDIFLGLHKDHSICLDKRHNDLAVLQANIIVVREERASFIFIVPDTTVV